MYCAATITTFGRSPDALYRLISTQANGLSLLVTISAEGLAETYTLPTIGEHNGYNAAAAVAAARALGVSWEAIKAGLAASLGLSHLITVGGKARYIAYAARRARMPFRKRQGVVKFLQGLLTEDNSCAP